MTSGGQSLIQCLAFLKARYQLFLLWHLIEQQQPLLLGLILINEDLSYLGLVITYFPRILGEGRANGVAKLWETLSVN